jgi:hypothetical protein
VLGLLWRSLRRGSVLQWCCRRVRGTHGLGVVTYSWGLAVALRVVSDNWRLVVAAHWLRRVLEGRICILKAPVRRRCRRRCPCGRAMGSWRCGVSKVVCGRRILDVAWLSICDSRRRGRRSRRVGERGGLRIAWSLVRREIGVVSHGNRFARWSGRHISVEFPQCLSQTFGRVNSRSTHVAYC